MRGRVEQWLHASERTPDRTIDERVSELLEAVRHGAQRNPGESWDAANERHAEEFIASLCAGFPGRAFEVCWPPAHDQPEKVFLQSLAYAEARPPAASIRSASRWCWSSASACARSRGEPPGTTTSSRCPATRWSGWCWWRTTTRGAVPGRTTTPRARRSSSST